MTSVLSLHKQHHTTPDGRSLWLYGLNPVQVRGGVPSPGPIHATPHLRWHPLRREWVIYAAHRQNRTFLPPADDNPLAPTDGQAHEAWTLHIELYPALRAPRKLKYLAGTNLGAGVFADDALPEANAQELREVKL